MTLNTGVSRPLELAERDRLRALDAAVPRRGREYRLRGGYRGAMARDASSAEYEALRSYAAELLRDGVSPGSVAVALELSVTSVRLWRKEAAEV